MNRKSSHRDIIKRIYQVLSTFRQQWEDIIESSTYYGYQDRPYQRHRHKKLTTNSSSEDLLTEDVSELSYNVEDLPYFVEITLENTKADLRDSIAQNKELLSTVLLLKQEIANLNYEYECLHSVHQRYKEESALDDVLAAEVRLNERNQLRVDKAMSKIDLNRNAKHISTLKQDLKDIQRKYYYASLLAVKLANIEMFGGIWISDIVDEAMEKGDTIKPDRSLLLQHYEKLQTHGKKKKKKKTLKSVVSKLMNVGKSKSVKGKSKKKAKECNASTSTYSF